MGTVYRKTTRDPRSEKPERFRGPGTRARKNRKVDYPRKIDFYSMILKALMVTERRSTETMYLPVIAKHDSPLTCAQ